MVCQNAREKRSLQVQDEAGKTKQASQQGIKSTARRCVHACTSAASQIAQAPLHQVNPHHDPTGLTVRGDCDD